MVAFGDRLALVAYLPGLSNDGETADEAEECALVGRVILIAGVAPTDDAGGDWLLLAPSAPLVLVRLEAQYSSL